MKQLIQQTLKAYKLDCSVGNPYNTPNTVIYPLSIPKGSKIRLLERHRGEIARDLGVSHVNIENASSGAYIEVERGEREVILFEDLLKHKDFINSHKNEVLLGVDRHNKIVLSDFTKWPHLLVAGATGSGKSVGIHQIILSLLAKNSPEQLKIQLFDPKQTELNYYDGIKHLWQSTITDSDKALESFNELANEMERRYSIMKRHNIREWNGNRILVVVDELADLIMQVKDIEKPIVRLAQKARACGIHLVLCTQRPTVNVLTGLIKANAPSRLSYRTVTGTDSRVILDGNGAERLLGRGDSLYRSSSGFEHQRIQSSYASDEIIERMVSIIKQKFGHKFQSRLHKLIYHIIKPFY